MVISKRTSYILIFALILTSCTAISKDVGIGATPSGKFYLDVISNNKNMVYNIYLEKTAIGQTPLKGYYFKEYKKNKIIKVVNPQTNKTRVEKKLSEIDWKLIDGDMNRIETDRVTQERRLKSPKERDLVYKGSIFIYE